MVVYKSRETAATVAYIRFRERQGDVETIRLTDDFLVDIDATGAVCGVELLNAAEQLKAGDGGKLVVLDALGGQVAALEVA
jgi:uncharacterized protein YuzE